MSSKIDIDDYVVCIIPASDWVHFITSEDNAGPNNGDILKVTAVKEFYGTLFLGFAEFGEFGFSLKCFKKVLPGGLDAWLDEVNMHPTWQGVKELV